MKEIIVIGAGLAGSEAALQIAKRGIKVKLYEMKPVKYSEAHSNEDLAVVNLPNLKTTGDYFLRCNKNLITTYLPKLDVVSKSILKDRFKVVDSIEKKEELYESTIKSTKKSKDVVIKEKKEEIKERSKGKK